MKVYIHAAHGRAVRELDLGGLPRTGDIVDLGEGEGMETEKWYVVKGVIWSLGSPVPSVRLVIDPLRDVDDPVLLG